MLTNNKYLQKYNKYKHKYLNIKGGSVIVEPNYNIIEKLCDKLFYLAISEYIKELPNNKTLYLSGIKATNIVSKNSNIPYIDSIYNIFIYDKETKICESVNLFTFWDSHLYFTIEKYCIPLGWIHIFKIYLLQSKNKSNIKDKTDKDLVTYICNLFVYDKNNKDIKFDGITIIKNTELRNITFNDKNTFSIHFRITENHYDKLLKFGKISLYVENVNLLECNEILDHTSSGLNDISKLLESKWQQIVKRNKEDVNSYTTIFSNDDSANELSNTLLSNYVFGLALLSYQKTGIYLFDKETGLSSFDKNELLQLIFPNILHFEETRRDGVIIKWSMKKNILFSLILCSYIISSRDINEGLINNTDPALVNIMVKHKDVPYFFNILQILEYFYEMMISLKKEITSTQQFTVYSFSQYLLFNEYLLIEAGQILTFNCFKSTTYNPFFESLPQFIGSDLLPMVFKIKIDPRINNLYMFIGNPLQFELVIAYGSQVKVVDIEVGYIDIKTGNDSIVKINCTIINCILLEHELYQTIEDKLRQRLKEEPTIHYNKLLEKKILLENELGITSDKFVFDNNKFETVKQSLEEFENELREEIESLGQSLHSIKDEQEIESVQEIINKKSVLLIEKQNDKRLFLKQKEFIDTINEIKELQLTLQSGGKLRVSNNSNTTSINKIKVNKSNLKDREYLKDLMKWVAKQPGQITLNN